MTRHFVPGARDRSPRNDPGRAGCVLAVAAIAAQAAVATLALSDAPASTVMTSSTPTSRSSLHNVLESIRLLRREHRVEREADTRHLDNSLMLMTPNNPHIGYEKAAQISPKAYRKDRPCGTRSSTCRRDRGAVR